MTLFEQLTADQIAAMKAKDELKLGTVRLLIAAIKNRQVAGATRLEATDELVLETIRSEQKKRRDSIEAYRAGNRPDLMEREAAEMKIIDEYLPAQPSEADIEAAVREAIAALPEPVTPKQFGAVMGAVKLKLPAADGSAVSAVVKRILSTQ